jgi:hypothetical protein
MHKFPFFRSISLYLVVATIIMTLPAQGWAMFIPSSDSAPVREAELAKIQRALESTIIKQRLADYGLTSDEVVTRLNTLSDEQIHQFAGDPDSLQAGGDGLSALIFLLLVAIVVVVILQASGHKIIVK